MSVPWGGGRRSRRSSASEETQSTTLDENPQWWPEEIARQKDSIGDDAHAWAEITVEVPDDAIQKALYPNQEVVSVKVI